MSVDTSAIFREMTGYLHRHPTDGTAMTPLFDALLDHSRHRHCLHEGRCPLLRVGAVLVDERERALALWYGKRWGFTEDIPNDADISLIQTAIRVLKENYGVYDTWTPPGADGPVLIEVSETENRTRLRFGFRYLFHTHSGAVLPSMVETG
nr:NUDIX hydrolase [Streptomyces sp. NBC_00857]